jgi:hypothetical protein
MAEHDRELARKEAVVQAAR